MEKAEIRLQNQWILLKVKQLTGLSDWFLIASGPL